LRSKEVTIKVEAKEDLEIFSNKIVLEIIINNLLDNACKFTELGTITLSAVKGEKHTIIKCCDTGIGISEKVSQELIQGQEKIF